MFSKFLLKIVFNDKAYHVDVDHRHHKRHHKRHKENEKYDLKPPLPNRRRRRRPRPRRRHRRRRHHHQHHHPVVTFSVELPIIIIVFHV